MRIKDKEQAFSQLGRHTGRKIVTNREEDRNTDIQTDRETYKETGRMTDRHRGRSIK